MTQLFVALIARLKGSTFVRAVAVLSTGTMIAQAAKKSGADQAELLGRAVEVLERGEAVGSKEVLYNLACAHVRLGDNGKVEHYLRASKRHKKLPDRAHIESDADFNSVRDEVWFKELLDELAPAD